MGDGAGVRDWLLRNAPVLSIPAVISAAGELELDSAAPRVALKRNDDLRVDLLDESHDAALDVEFSGFLGRR